MAMIMYMHKLN